MFFRNPFLHLRVKYKTVREVEERWRKDVGEAKYFEAREVADKAELKVGNGCTDGEKRGVLRVVQAVRELVQSTRRARVHFAFSQSWGCSSFVKLQLCLQFDDQNRQSTHQVELVLWVIGVPTRWVTELTKEGFKLLGAALRRKARRDGEVVDKDGTRVVLEVLQHNTARVLERLRRNVAPLGP